MLILLILAIGALCTLILMATYDAGVRDAHNRRENELHGRGPLKWTHRK